MTELNTGTDKLLGRVHGPVAVLSFNRPESRNALSDEIYDGFNTALPQVAQRDDIRVLMVTGEGGAFCSGGDVKGFRASHAGEGESMTHEESLDRLRRNQMWISGAFRKLPKPVVAAIPGLPQVQGSRSPLPQISGSQQKAIFVSAFSTIGASGDFGSSWFLPRLIGEAKAKEFMFLSPRVSASEALNLGLINRMFADAEFNDAAMAFCDELAARSPIAMRMQKENIQRSFNADVATALDAEATAMMRAMSTADHREAVAAFFDKRTPNFIGR